MKKVLIALTVLGILTAFVFTVINDLVELRHREVEVAVDFSDVQALARDAAISDRDMLIQLRGLGATAVGLREAHVNRYRLEGSLSVLTGGELQNAARTGEVHPRLAEILDRGTVPPNAVYLVTDSAELADRLYDKAQLKLKKPVRSFYNSAPYVIEIIEDIGKVNALRIGLDPRDVELVQSLGMRIVPRPDNLFLNDREAVAETYAEFLSLPQDLLSAVIFEGAEAAGFPHFLSTAAASLSEAGIPFGVIEYNARQAGSFQIADNTDYNVVLVHSNWSNETAQAIVNSVRERRVRLLYVRFNLNTPDFLERGQGLLSDVSALLKQHGFVPGPARAFATPQRGAEYLLLMLIGLAAASVLLLIAIIGREPCPLWLLFAATLAGLLAMFPVLSANLAIQAASILAAIVFSSLAVISQQFNRLPHKPLGNRQAFTWALTTILRTFAFILAGGILVIGLTSSRYFVSGVPLWRGVKLVHTLPLLIIGVVAVMRVFYPDKKVWTLQGICQLGRDLLGRPMLVLYMLILAVLGVFAYIYVGRTGHSAGIPVPVAEQQMRLLLGEFLLVRPRIKEFLFGYPLMLAGLTFLARGYRNAFTAVAVIFGAVAAVSMTNTFMHFTTPAYNTLIRSLNGLWLGLLLGTLLTLAALLVYHVAEKAARP